VRDPRVELRGVARPELLLRVAEREPQAAGQDVQPLERSGALAPQTADPRRCSPADSQNLSNSRS
jgi:hypothetical protein